MSSGKESIDDVLRRLGVKLPESEEPGRRAFLISPDGAVKEARSEEHIGSLYQEWLDSDEEDDGEERQATMKRWENLRTMGLVGHIDRDSVAHKRIDSDGVPYRYSTRLDFIPKQVPFTNEPIYGYKSPGKRRDRHTTE